MSLRPEHPLRLLCKLLEVPRSSVYYQSQAGPGVDLISLKALILSVRVTFPGMGFRKMYFYLIRHYARYSRSTVRRAFVELGIIGKARQALPKTTNSKSTRNRFPNLMKELNIDHPNQVWVGDVTCLKVGTRFVYLAHLMDAYSRMILGWALSFSNDTTLALAALDMALLTGYPTLHHTDQGCPYGSTAYLKRLGQHPIQSSMSDVGKPEDNGKSERFNRSVKEEEAYRNEYQNLPEARKAIDAYITKYNNLPPPVP